MPSEKALDEYYQLYWKERPVDQGLISLFQAQTRSRSIFLQPFLPSKGSLRVLDIGAGLGPIGPALREFLPDVDVIYDAVETDPAALDYLKAEAGARATYASLTGVQGEYDLVVLSHVLEHMTDPVGFLNAAVKRTAPGGIIMAESPNLDFVYKAQNEPHVIFFSPKTFRGLAEKAGLQVLASETCGHSIRRLVGNLTLSRMRKTVKAGLKTVVAALGRTAQTAAVPGESRLKAAAPVAVKIRDVMYVYQTSPSGRAAVRIIARKKA